MLVLSLLGSASEDFYVRIANKLASSGYRVASAVQSRKVDMPKELKNLTRGGAMVTLNYSKSRVLISTGFVPEDVKGLIKLVRCLMPVEPDVLILLGFRRMTLSDEGVVKVLACKSEGELRKLKSEARGEVLGEVICSDDCPDDEALEIIKRAQGKRYLPSPLRGI